MAAVAFAACGTDSKDDQPPCKTGALACQKPIRNRWGGPPNGGAQGPQAATNLAFAPRGQVQLATSIKQDVPEIGLKKGVLEPLKKK